MFESFSRQGRLSQNDTKKEITTGILEHFEEKENEHVTPFQIPEQEIGDWDKRLFYQKQVPSTEGFLFPDISTSCDEDGFLYRDNFVHLESPRWLSYREEPLVYFSFCDKHLFTLCFNSDNTIKSVIQGSFLGDYDKEIVIAALSSPVDFPYREYLMRYFGVEEDLSLRTKLEQRFASERRRVDSLETEYAHTPKLPGWETTDPKNHNPSSFRYIVHTVSETGKFLQILKSLKFDTEEVDDDSNFDVDPFEDPEAFVCRSSLSTSVIDQTHYGLFADVGFILSVPRENIVQASSDTLAATIIHSDANEYEYSVDVSAQQILDYTHGTSYNEVVIQGTKPGTTNSIEIVGGVIVVNPISGQPHDLGEYEKIRSFCEQRSLPLVFLPRPL